MMSIPFCFVVFRSVHIISTGCKTYVIVHVSLLTQVQHQGAHDLGSMHIAQFKGSMVIVLLLACSYGTLPCWLHGRTALPTLFVYKLTRT
jgi:hypothetical protein